MSENKYGKLLTPDIKLHRHYFKEMTKLLGVRCLYYEPRPETSFDTHGDLEANYFPPVECMCIFTDYPDQKTLRKMGWAAELQEGSSIIHVPYDLHGLRAGALFSVPSGIDGAPDRLFRVINMQVTMIYPASISCEIGLEYEDQDEPVQVRDFRQENFSLLVDNEEDD